MIDAKSFSIDVYFFGDLIFVKTVWIISKEVNVCPEKIPISKTF